jgi:murein DD-endopeptidase MepM/ murein hydrolase activator NlpD
MRATRTVIACLATAALLPAEEATAAGSSAVAALQVALRAKGAYAGPVSGVSDSRTRAAVRRFQRRAGLMPDGIAGPRTRAALGRLGRPSLGARAITRGNVGWDVAELQFLLAWRGFPSGTFDGVFGGRTARALLRYQRWAGLPRDGVAGPAILAALRSPPARPPVHLARPAHLPLGGGFGPRDARFHTGLDFPGPVGAPVEAARSGRVVFAGWHARGWGYLVTVAHGRGLRTMYAHLSAVAVRVGQRVSQRTLVGRVGATGRSHGPHLHFEARLRGAAVDPLPMMH